MEEQKKTADERATCGWLYKWTNYIHGYQTRWFVISNGFMSYYRSSGDVVDGICRGSICLSAAIVYANDAKSFIVSSGQDTFHLKANTSNERDVWVRAISAETDKMTSVAATGNKLLEEMLHNLEKKFDQLQSYATTVQKKTPAFQKELQALMKMELTPKLQQKLQVLLDSLRVLLETFKNINLTSDEILVMSRNLRNELRSISNNTRQLEEMVEELGLQHRNLETKIQQTLNLIQHTRTMQNISEADDSRDAVGQDDEFFDALSEEATELVIRMPSFKKFETEEPSVLSQEADLSRYSGTDASEDGSKHCLACVFQRKPKQKKVDLPDSGPLRGASGKRSSLFQQTVVMMSRKESGVPQFNRRLMIPPQPSSGSSLWAVLKSFVGKDISRISLPVCFNEPLTFLQRMTEELEYSECLDRASRCDSSLEQMTHVAAFAISSYASTALRVTKPFNPLLGETYECDRRADYGWKCFTEQVSHHPPTMAMHAESRDWTLWQEFTMISKFKGHYIQITPVGYCHLLFPKSGNHYTWQKMETTVHNIIVGQVWLDHHGEKTIANHLTGDTCQLVFHSYSYMYKDNNRKVTGIVGNAKGEVSYILQGTWDEKMESCQVLSQSASSRGKLSFNTDEPIIVWKNNAVPLNASYKFTQLAIQLNELEPNVAPTDSRLRPDVRLMEEGTMDEADKIKVLLEEKQRSSRRRRHSMAVVKGLDPEQAEVALYEPKWFRREEDPQTGFAICRFTHEYWSCKKRQDWSRCPSIFI